MTLKRQLLLVSLLTLMLPWAGCEFIRETESALRASQQTMLAGLARAIADSLAGYPEAFPDARAGDPGAGDQLFGHALAEAPAIDGYFDDWPIERDVLEEMRGTDGPIRFALGVTGQFLFVYAEVRDRSPVYADAQSILRPASGPFADRVNLVSMSPPYLDESLTVAAEAPGPVIAYLDAASIVGEPTVRAHWQDVPGGYQVEMRVPLNLLGTHLGVEVENVSDASRPGIRSASFDAASPGRFVTRSPELATRADALVQPGMRLIVTDANGWRIARAGAIDSRRSPANGGMRRWLRMAYSNLVESGREAVFAEPAPRGREWQPYIQDSLDRRPSAEWFRSDASGRAVVAVSEPVVLDSALLGVVVLQQGTDEILSLTNEGLARLMYVTLIAMLVVAGTLLGYATWLSRRIRALSVAAEDALDADTAGARLPSADSADEIGDLSRSFSDVLTQLGDYNAYLRTLASKLSHELRTPLAIVTSSLENLEHESLNEAAAGYTARARDGADRLRRILSAMSEASRVEELMRDVEPDRFDLVAVVGSTVTAYRDVYPARSFRFEADSDEMVINGSPELLIQMLDKLVDNAVGFSADGDEIVIELERGDGRVALSVENPGPPLPNRMRGKLFDSMVSVRAGRDDKHLGLGLYVAKLIADGHGGSIEAANTERGVRFTVRLPAAGAKD